MDRFSNRGTKTRICMEMARLDARERTNRAKGIEDLVGNTPLLPLRRLAEEVAPVEIRVKCEWTNPGGSVKDRPALAMIRDAEDRGLLRGGRSLLDSTSGNTGIALALYGAARGHRVVLCIPANASLERRRILRLLGAELILTDPTEGSDGARVFARALAERERDRYVYLDQYANPANWRSHYETTANEIWEQTDGRVSHFVACLGTTGTFVGTSRRLRELAPSVRLISVEPDAPFHGIEGTRYQGAGDDPPIYDPALADARVAVATEDAQEMARRLAREEGLTAGVSGGAAVVAALRVARESASGLVVAVLPDSAMRSISEAFWDPAGEEA